MTSSVFVRLVFAAALAICLLLAISQQEKLHPVAAMSSAKTLASQLANRPAQYTAAPYQAGNRPSAVDDRPVQDMHGPINKGQRDLAFLALAIAGVSAFLVCLFIIRYEHLHAHFSHDHIDSGPQKFHAQPTPRIGGVALAVGLVAAGLGILLVNGIDDVQIYGLLLLTAIPAFTGGLLEDITKRVGVLERLLATMLSAALAALLLGAVLTHMEIPLLREALTWIPFAVAFTVFAVGGVANAINIIDGCNGLAPGYSFITLMAFAWIAAQTGDAPMLVASLAMAGALLGFFFWNWPGGKIFLGDGGAYVLGFWMAEIAVLLVARNPELHPKLFLALMIYPVFETLFSIYRRKFLQKSHPGLPDNRHLHQLIYRNRTRKLSETANPTELTRRNSAVAPYLWGVMIIFATLALYYRQSQGGLVFVVLSFCVVYVWGYFHLLNKTKA